MSLATPSLCRGTGRSDASHRFGVRCVTDSACGASSVQRAVRHRFGVQCGTPRGMWRAVLIGVHRSIGRRKFGFGLARGSGSAIALDSLGSAGGDWQLGGLRRGGVVIDVERMVVGRCAGLAVVRVTFQSRGSYGVRMDLGHT
jgi:hypothetical protein